MLEIEIEEASFDVPGAYSQIADYCARNQIPPKTAMRIRLVFEELVQQILFPRPGEISLRFRLEYSEADESAEIIVEFSGEPFDPETDETRLPLTLIRNAAIDIRSETSRDSTRNNRIFMRIRS